MSVLYDPFKKKRLNGAVALKHYTQTKQYIYKQDDNSDLLTCNALFMKLYNIKERALRKRAYNVFF